MRPNRGCSHTGSLRTCLHGGGGPQVGGVSRLSIISLIFIWSCLHDSGVARLGGLPGLPGRVTLSAGVTFCHVNDSWWGNPPSRGRVHVTVNCLWQRLCFIKSDSKKPQHWNVAARVDYKRKRTLTAKMRRSPAIFSVNMPSDHATTSCKVTPGPGVVSLHVNAGHLLTTARRVTSPT